MGQTPRELRKDRGVSWWSAGAGGLRGGLREGCQEAPRGKSTKEAQRPAVYIGRWGRGENADIPSASIRNYVRKGCFVGTWFRFEDGEVLEVDGDDGCTPL